MLIENFRPGHARAVGPRSGAPPRTQPPARHRPGDRVRADRPVRAPSRVRVAGRGDERVRRADRRARRSADAAAVRARRRHRRAGHELRRDRPPLRSAGGVSGHGPGVDMAIIEPIMMLLGGQITAFDQLGIVQRRVGNRSVNNAPRNVYRTGDGEWVAVSTSSQSIAERVMRLVGRPDLIDEPWFATRASAGRARRRARRRRVVVDRSPPDRRGASPRSSEAEAAVGPVYDVRGVLDRPAVRRRSARSPPSTTTSSDRSRCRTCCSACPDRPASIRWAGRPHGADTDAVLGELGYDRRRARRAAGAEGVV